MPTRRRAAPPGAGDALGTGLLLRRAHRALARALTPRFAAYGVSVGAFNVLVALWQHDGLTQIELGQRVDVDKATLTPIFDGLQRAGLIERRRNPDDRRRNNVFLTARGRAVRAPLLRIASGVVAGAVRGLSDDELAVLRRGLATILANLGEPLASGPGIVSTPR
ncbi:MAG TPA: MarR family transcriptional regulator [Candidatus Limnocylindria bacterium]|jgi:DNA-binding MarR family transcriptional regulator|nr:MarR family transcriptional regulator [Candidatus Limnocylindria bacterium]